MKVRVFVSIPFCIDYAEEGAKQRFRGNIFSVKGDEETRPLQRYRRV
jgi:hypothetical protein